MSRRTKQLFSLSLLDLLTSALGAIIFLFIITPKGGESAAKVRQAMVYFDTTQMKIYGDLPDSLLLKSAGDTLHTVLVAFKDLPKEKPQKKFAYNEPRPKPIRQPKPKPETQKPKVNQSPAIPPVTMSEPKKKPIPTPELPKPKPKPPTKKPDPKPPVYKGDAPSVPCQVSFEINWPSKEDNIDLYVCRGNTCVYGGRKKDKKVGYWDSGKSRNKIFGNDLRTNQEAVRQFDKIIPGEYNIYAQFKDSKASRTAVTVNGLIYIKGEDNVERGEDFRKKLQRGKGRTLLATVILKEDGTYILK